MPGIWKHLIIENSIVVEVLTHTKGNIYNFTSPVSV